MTKHAQFWSRNARKIVSTAKGFLVYFEAETAPFLSLAACIKVGRGVEMQTLGSVMRSTVDDDDDDDDDDDERMNFNVA